MLREALSPRRKCAFCWIKVLPHRLRQFLTQHEVITAYERGWSQLSNGKLLDAAEADGFGTLVTTDMNLRYHVNLGASRLAIVVLTTTSWPRIQRAAHLVIHAVDAAAEGSYTEVAIP